MHVRRERPLVQARRSTATVRDLPERHILLLVNESGAMAKARFSDRSRPNLLILDNSPEWHVAHAALYGVVSADGRRIDWPGGDFWAR